ncbi:hypothetical protein LTR62_002715 [Meristemomyces frigidus]|uniref:Uncharacterized protein n=1 Tax=Meristemomyces frigidus TaxID=1508187 RepID=A0AAN7TQN8_9PEZI|nr:hypothetical protein LTR62_002715 [Meristemomyces frigidus]
MAGVRGYIEDEGAANRIAIANGTTGVVMPAVYPAASPSNVPSDDDSDGDALGDLEKRMAEDPSFVLITEEDTAQLSAPQEDEDDDLANDFSFRLYSILEHPEIPEDTMSQISAKRVVVHSMRLIRGLFRKCIKASRSSVLKRNTLIKAARKAIFKKSDHNLTVDDTILDELRSIVAEQVVAVLCDLVWFEQDSDADWGRAYAGDETMEQLGLMETAFNTVELGLEKQVHELLNTIIQQLPKSSEAANTSSTSAEPVGVEAGSSNAPRLSTNGTAKRTAGIPWEAKERLMCWTLFWHPQDLRKVNRRTGVTTQMRADAFSEWVLVNTKHKSRREWAAMEQHINAIKHPKDSKNARTPPTFQSLQHDVDMEEAGKAASIAAEAANMLARLDTQASGGTLYTHTPRNGEEAEDLLSQRTLLASEKQRAERELLTSDNVFTLVSEDSEKRNVDSMVIPVTSTDADGEGAGPAQKRRKGVEMEGVEALEISENEQEIASILANELL